MDRRLRDLERQYYASCDLEDLKKILHYLKRNNKLYSYEIHEKYLRTCDNILVADKEEIIEAFAKTYWANAYIEWADLLNREIALEEELVPRGGGRWEDYIPEEIPKEAKDRAKLIIKDIEKRNKTSIEAIYEILTDHGTIMDDVEEFGYLLVMPILGHGVGWSGYYPDHKLDLPYDELSWYEIDAEVFENILPGYAQYMEDDDD